MQARLGISTVTCELCQRNAQGLPLPALAAYKPEDNLAFSVAQLMGDQDILEKHQPQVLVAEMPQSIIDRMIAKIVPERLRRTPQPVAQNATGAPVGPTAQSIAKSRKRDKLFE